MNRSTENPSFHRRTLIKGAAALGLTTFVRCQAEEIALGDAPITTDKPKASLFGCRLYKVIPAVDQFYSHVGEMKPAPVMYHWNYKRLARRQVTDPPQIEYFVWASLVEAATIGAHESVKAMQEVTPATVVVLGEKSKANGTLSVKLFPNSAFGKVENEFAATEEVIKIWTEQLKGIPGVKVSAPEEPKESMAIGDRADKGQVVIEFEGDRLPAKVLEVIKGHPQTLAIKWGSLFTHFYCPGCGLG